MTSTLTVSSPHMNGGPIIFQSQMYDLAVSFNIDAWTSIYPLSNMWPASSNQNTTHSVTFMSHWSSQTTHSVTFMSHWPSQYDQHSYRWKSDNVWPQFIHILEFIIRTSRVYIQYADDMYVYVAICYIEWVSSENSPYVAVGIRKLPKKRSSAGLIPIHYCTDVDRTMRYEHKGNLWDRVDVKCPRNRFP